MGNNISIEDVKESITYFKTKKIEQKEMFYFFLILKSLNFNENFPRNIALRKMDDAEKELMRLNLYLLGGTFNYKFEDCDKYGVSFPSGIYELHMGSTNEKNIFYQPGSTFSGVLSRIRDTLKNFRGIKFYEYNENEDSIKFNIDYIDTILREYLGSEKISLKHIISWTFKFISFETTDDDVSSIQFSLMLKKHFIKTFKLTKRELSKLFIDDLYIEPLKNSSEQISGETYRTESGLKQYLKDHSDMQYEDIYSEIDYKQQLYNFKFTTSTVNDIVLQQSGDNPSPSEVENILKNQKQIILTGVPGTGKSFYTREIEKSPFFNGKKTVIQFHPNYTYEDFIGGDVLTVIDGSTTSQSKKGVFLDFIDEARQDENRNYLFIIDEINRGNIANIFGETILMLDREYTVNLAKPIENIDNINIPDNVYLIGTMNTSDRNIAFLDLAIRRRFAFVPLVPNYEYLTDNIRIENQERYNLGAILKFINEKIVSSLKDENLTLGQSYFIPNNSGEMWTEDDFKIQFNYVLIPTLNEYSYNQPNLVYSIIGDLSDQVQDTQLFYERFKNQFGDFIL